MAIDQQPFPMNALDLQGKKVLIWPEAAESANKDNVVIGEPRDNKQKDKVLAREIVLSRQPDGKETIKITIGNPALGGATPGMMRIAAKIYQAKQSGSRQMENQQKSA